MQKVVSFYEKLPRGPAPAEQSSGLFSWYKNKYFKRGNESAARTYKIFWTMLELGTNFVVALAHLIAFFTLIGYAQNYYFHLRMFCSSSCWLRRTSTDIATRTPQEQRPLSVEIPLYSAWNDGGVK